MTLKHAPFKPEVEPRPFPGWHFILWPAAVALLLTVFHYWRHTPDDGFIHLTYVRNFARTGRFIFEGKPSYGHTSPLSVVVAAVPVYLGADPLVTIKVLGYLNTVLAVLGAALLAHRAAGRLAGVAMGAVLCCDPWLLRWAVSGLETPFALALVVWATVFLQRGRWIAAAFLGGLLPLVRPDLTPFTGLVGLTLLWLARGKRRELTVGLILLVLPGLLWACYARYSFGTIVPNTVRAKAFLYDLTPAQRVKQVSEILLVDHGLLLLVAMGFLLAWARRGWQPIGRNIRLVVAVWPVLLIGVYVLTGSVIATRYFTPAVVFLYLISIIGLCTLRRGARAATVGVVAASCALCLGLTERRIAPGIDEYTRHFARVTEITDWLNSHAGPSDTVASGDIGFLGFYDKSGYHVLDLAGLVTPEMLITRPDRMSYVRRQRPRFWIERSAVRDRVAEGRAGEGQLSQIAKPGDEPGLHFERAILLGPPGLSSSQDVWYSLYSLDWDR